MSSNNLAQKIWMLSFESSDVVQVGGLGPAVSSLARALAKKHSVTIFMPSHGKHRDADTRLKLGLQELERHRIKGDRKGVDGNYYPFEIGFESGFFHGVRYILARGLDDKTSFWLDNPQVYDGEITFQKMALFARAMAGFLDSNIRGGPHDLPSVIHAHDWHVVPAAVSAKQILQEFKSEISLVYTIHLLGGKGLPWHYISQDWCGIKNDEHLVNTGLEWRSLRYKEVWDDLSSGKFEKFGSYEADLLTTVSRNYLESDVLSSLGSNFVSKAGVIYNGCDWDEGAITRKVLTQHEQNLVLHNSPINRQELRKYLLTRALGEVFTPYVGEPEIRSAIQSATSTSGGNPNSLPRTFQEDGELVLMTGRLDRQKGVDVLLRAVPIILETLPSAKFLLLLIPILQKELIFATVQQAAMFGKNVRLILGRAPEIYGLAHISADAYAMPSRWEPFGLSALEAMATGNPVAGTRVGGINETVLDINVYSNRGTGLLVRSDDHKELAEALISFLIMMKLGQDIGAKVLPINKSSLIEKIPCDSVRHLVEVEPATAGSLIRSNCRQRVKSDFSPDRAAQNAIEAYEKAHELVAIRNKRKPSGDI